MCNNYNNYNDNEPYTYSDIYDDYWDYTYIDNSLYKFDTISFTKKILSIVIDILISLFIQFILVYLFISIKVPYLRNNQILIWLIIIHILSFLSSYVIIPLLFSGQTIGYKMLSMKMVKGNGYSPSFIDYLIKYLFKYLLIIDILYCAFSFDHRFLHNKITNTYLIEI